MKIAKLSRLFAFTAALAFAMVAFGGTNTAQAANPCGGGSMNPCAAKKMPANPCGGGSMNPCAAKKMPANPCAAGKKMKKMKNMHNPCGGTMKMNPCAASKKSSPAY